MRALSYILFVLATACSYARLPLPTASEVREGGFPSRVDRFLQQAGGARTSDRLLPESARDSAAIYLLVVNPRAEGLGSAEVVVLPRAAAGRTYPRDGWRAVDAFGVYAGRFELGEYIVFVRDPHAWSTRRALKLKAGVIDTLLAVMRTGMAPRAAW
jgi:hypothetical protein